MRTFSVFFLAVALCLISTPSRATVANEIVARNIAARGGIDKIRALQSLRLTGTARFGGGDWSIEASFGIAQKRAARTPEGSERPGKVRTEASFQGLTAVDAWDGSEGWATEPWGGRREPFRKSADESKSMAHEADFDGPLVDADKKGIKIEYLGTEDIDGSKAHKLRVTRPDGDIEIRYLDPDAFLEIRVVHVAKIRGVEHVHESDLGDYEQVAGVWIPMSIDSGSKGRPRDSHVHFDRAEANAPLDDSLFSFPAAGSNVTRAIAASASTSPAPTSPAPTSPATPPVVDSSVVSGLGARNIGSAAMSGRISAVAGYNVNGRTVLYVGAASGGVWKSKDNGTTFKPIFDKEPVQSIGAIAVDPSNWNNVWVGTGEAWTRNSTSIGNGVYKSADGGDTWENVGLPESERIVRILVHPRDSSVVYVCAPGKLWSDSADRGVYKTIDGGKSWTQILKGGSLSTGCSDLAMDPSNPDVLFAGLWDFRRKGWTFRSGGDGPDAQSGSGLYRSADGGRNWTQLTPATSKGLPPAPWGRVAVTIAPSDPRIVYALVESKDSALYRSADGGATWERRDSSQKMVWRPFYFARLIVDPLVADRVFKPDLRLIVSEDGGKSFSDSGGGSHGDWHDLWINPTNPSHIVGGDDGGLWTSFDGGSRWVKNQNLPVSQFYHVSVDDEDPYRVYGGLQDNASWVGDSSYPGGITNARWENLYDGDGFWVIVDPTDSSYVYAESQGGYIGRVNRKTHTARDIQPKARYKEKLRFNWNSPIHASPTQRATIYLGAQFLFRSRDRGDTWERISPDLTTNDPDKQKQEQSGGVTVDNSSAEMHTTIYSISESPKNAQTIWVGTDDGNLQLTRDGGKTWNNLVGNVPGLPKNSWVSWVEASRFDAGTAYAAFDRHTLGDMNPWVYKTIDYGKTWTRIVSPDKGVRGYTHVIKEDTVEPRLLFVGTELGLWISVDGGASWAEFKGGDFPSVAVREVQVQPREGDLVIATHGRGIWIIDDISPLRALLLSQDKLSKPAAFLAGRPVQQRMPAHGGWVEGDAAFVGRSAPSGAVVTYYQRSRHLFGPLKLEVLDPSGKAIDTIAATTRRGINRVSWTMQTKAPKVPRAAQVAFSATQGPRVVPGKYTLRMTKGDQTIETPLVIGPDRRATYSAADRKAHFDAAERVSTLFSEMSALVERIDATRRGAEARMQSLRSLDARDALAEKVAAVNKKLEELKKKIVATKEGGAITGEERIREHLDILYGAFQAWEGRPARYQLERIDVLGRELHEVAAEFDAVASKEVKALDAELRAHSLEPIPTTASPQASLDDDDGEGPAVAAALACVVGRGGSSACERAERAARDMESHRGERD